MSEVYSERIDKIIASLGLMSRKDCARAAKNGRITVDGAVEKSTARKVTDKNVLCLDGEAVVYSKYMYILLNKPVGYVCAAEDGKYSTVFELLPKEYCNLGLFTVGRLDMNTTGVLLITNDGALSHALLSPKNKIYKTYRVKTKFPVSDNDIAMASKGLVLDGEDVSLPADINIVDECLADIRVYEGKFHLIKRIFLALHNQVRELERIEFCGITCDGLNNGSWRFLTEIEISKLRNAVNKQKA